MSKNLIISTQNDSGIIVRFVRSQNTYFTIAIYLLNQLSRTVSCFLYKKK
uniref:Uncharacterized protein n=1 Tax=Anguilla anguilla TaxID=7936 RepID=A0A0E9QXS9_ANGAN